MPALPSVATVAEKEKPAVEKVDRAASIARAREAQAAWAELARECDDALAEVRAQLALLRGAVEGYAKELDARPAGRLKRGDKRAMVAAASALVHLDACVARIRDREARTAAVAAKRAAKLGARVRKIPQT